MRYLGAAVVALAATAPALGGVVFDQPAQTKLAPFVDRVAETPTTAAFTAVAFRESSPVAGDEVAGLGRWSLGRAAVTELDFDGSLTGASSIGYTGELMMLSRRGSIGSRVAGMAPALGAVAVLGLGGMVLVLRPRH